MGRRALITILGNLVDNALDSVAGPRNTGGAVNVELLREAAALEMSVRDNGTGIPPELGATVFNEGFTTKGTDTHSGLGLTLVRQAVSSLNGTVTVEAEGTVFRVVIPDAFEEVGVEVR